MSRPSFLRLHYAKTLLLLVGIAPNEADFTVPRLLLGIDAEAVSRGI
jgi:hypothetical protein